MKFIFINFIIYHYLIQDEKKNNDILKLLLNYINYIKFVKP